MKVLKWLDENFEEKIMSLSLWSIVIIMGLQIIMRYIFKSSLKWSEEVSRYLFIWMVFIGISYGVKNGSHMRIDMLEVFFPRIKKFFGILSDLSFLVFSIYIIGPGFNVINSLISTGQKSPAGGIPMYLVYISLLVGFFLVIFRIIQKYILLFLRNRTLKGENL